MAGNLGGLVKRLQDIMRQDAGINGDAQRIEQIVWMLFLKVYSAKEEEWEFADKAYISIIPEDYRWQNWAVDDGKQSAGHAGEFYTPRAVTDFMAKMIEPHLGEKMADFACGTGGFITSWLKELAPQVKNTIDRQLFSHSIHGVEKKQFPYMRGH